MCSTIIAGAASSSPPSSWENQPAGQGQENLFSTSSEKASRRRLCQNWRYRKEVWRSSVFSSLLICSFGGRKRRAVASCSIAVSGRAGGRGELPLPFSKPGFASWLEWLCWQQARGGAAGRCQVQAILDQFSAPHNSALEAAASISLMAGPDLVQVKQTSQFTLFTALHYLHKYMQ